MRKAIIPCLVLGLLSLTSTVSYPAAAEQYPAKPIRLIVPFPPGGGMDAAARIVGAKLSEYLGQQVVVDNRPGAGGSIGSQLAARSAPDGYTLLMGSTATHAINASLYSNLAYDPVKDFSPVALVASTPSLLVVHPSLPAKNVAELIALAKKGGTELSFASAGPGSTQHLAGELFKSMTGTRILHVPYKGAAPAMSDLVGGQVSMAFDTMPSAMPQVQTGTVRALGITTLKRSASLQNVPTIAETVPGYEVLTWFGVFAPRETPAAIVTQVSTEIRKSLRVKDVQDRLAAVGLDAIDGSPEEFAALIQRELPKWRKVVEDSGAKTD
jgi:tripartite-type tricarboxylate transporter receptor subunit TctC